MIEFFFFKYKFTFVGSKHGSEDGHLGRPEQQLLSPDEGRVVAGEGGEAPDVVVGEGDTGHAHGQGGGQCGGQAVAQWPVHVLVARPHQRAVVAGAF